MNTEPKKKAESEDKDEVTMARSIVDEIIKETESEDWDRKRPQENPTAKGNRPMTLDP